MITYLILLLADLIELSASVLHMLLNGLLCLVVAGICFLLCWAVLRFICENVCKGLFNFRIQWALNTLEIERKKRGDKDDK